MQLVVRGNHTGGIYDYVGHCMNISRYAGFATGGGARKEAAIVVTVDAEGFDGPYPRLDGFMPSLDFFEEDFESVR